MKFIKNDEHTLSWIGQHFVPAKLVFQSIQDFQLEINNTWDQYDKMRHLMKLFQVKY